MLNFMFAKNNNSGNDNLSTIGSFGNTNTFYQPKPTNTLDAMGKAVTPNSASSNMHEEVKTTTHHNLYGNEETVVQKTMVIKNMGGSEPLKIQNPEKITITQNRDGSQDITKSTVVPNNLRPFLGDETKDSTSVHVTPGWMSTQYQTVQKTRSLLDGSEQTQNGPTFTHNRLTSQYSSTTSNPLIPGQTQSSVPITVPTATQNLMDIVNKLRK